MLVLGESILNDAVSIVLATTALETDQIAGSVLTKVIDSVIRFLVVFFGSAVIGVINALLAALLFKHIALRKNPSLELGMMLIFVYIPYGLAEGVKLSGIQALVFNGIVMSHYTHLNLSVTTQVVMQSTLRTLAFIAETCVFAYLGDFRTAGIQFGRTEFLISFSSFALEQASRCSVSSWPSNHRSSSGA